MRSRNLIGWPCRNGLRLYNDLVRRIDERITTDTSDVLWVHCIFGIDDGLPEIFNQRFFSGAALTAILNEVLLP